MVGNRCIHIGTAAGAPPANYQVTLGNKVANAGSVYNAAPLTTSMNSNIRDDT